MTFKASLNTKGFAEYLERIAEVGGNVDEAADEALLAGAEILLAGMVARAPEDTGNLKSELKRGDVQVDGNYHFIEVGLIETDERTAVYGNAQEYGWGPNHSAHPYVRPAIDEDGKKAKAAMIDVFKQRMGL